MIGAFVVTLTWADALIVAAVAVVIYAVMARL